MPQFLRERYEGRFLITVGYYVEYQLLPLAFGLVEKENISNWRWFMRRLRRGVIGDDKRICVISDRHLTKKRFSNVSYMVGMRQVV
jgi:MULE transposase domain